jgi:hypothetical protein
MFHSLDLFDAGSLSAAERRTVREILVRHDRDLGRVAADDDRLDEVHVDAAALAAAVGLDALARRILRTDDALMLSRATPELAAARARLLARLGPD